MILQTYEEFLKSKQVAFQPSGIEIDRSVINP